MVKDKNYAATQTSHMVYMHKSCLYLSTLIEILFTIGASWPPIRNFILFIRQMSTFLIIDLLMATTHLYETRIEHMRCFFGTNEMRRCQKTPHVFDLDDF